MVCHVIFNHIVSYQFISYLLSYAIGAAGGGPGGLAEDHDKIRTREAIENSQLIFGKERPPGRRPRLSYPVGAGGGGPGGRARDPAGHAGSSQYAHNCIVSYQFISYCVVVSCRSWRRPRRPCARPGGARRFKPRSANLHPSLHALHVILSSSATSFHYIVLYSNIVSLYSIATQS